MHDLSSGFTPSFDSAWRRRALAGDESAVEILARFALSPLYSFCFWRVGRDQHLCEEVVQETLLCAIRRLADYDPKRSRNNIFPWLAGLARNEIHRLLAFHRDAVSLESLWLKMDQDLLQVFARLESDPFSDELLQREETRQMVAATMSQLSPHYQQALKAKYVNGQSVREMANTCNTTEKAVESLLSRAREAFRATFLALTRHLQPEMTGPRST